MTNSSTISSTQWSEPVDAKASRSTRSLLALIRIYQRLAAGRPSPCRFYPSCSHYAAEAIAVHGALRGTALSLRRLSRCRPLGPHGVDLVPLRKES
ncbi:MAG: membrane protein insertion efficiency factor YidD [Acidimicrobiales bacterium]